MDACSAHGSLANDMLGGITVPDSSGFPQRYSPEICPTRKRFWSYVSDGVAVGSDHEIAYRLTYVGHSPI